MSNILSAVLVMSRRTRLAKAALKQQKGERNEKDPEDVQHVTGQDRLNMLEQEDKERVMACVHTTQLRWRYTAFSLDRKLMIRRLRMEGKLIYEGSRLFTWLTLFVLLLLSTTRPINNNQELEVHEFVKNHLGLGALDSIRTTPEMWEVVNTISEQSKSLLLSSSAFVRDDDYQRLVTSRRKFAAPVVVDVDINIKKQFTVTSWVFIRNANVDIDKTILKKAPKNNYSATCWSFNLNGEVSFGEHDQGFSGPQKFDPFGSTNQFKVPVGWNLITYVYEEIDPEDPSHNDDAHGDAHESSASTNASSQTLSFYLNSDRVYAKSLSRPLTDCTGAVIMGSQELILGTLTIIPRTVSGYQIVELLNTGQTLHDSTVGQVPEVFTGAEGPIPRTVVDTTNFLSDEIRSSTFYNIEKQKKDREQAIKDVVITQPAMRAMKTQSVTSAASNTTRNVGWMEDSMRQSRSPKSRKFRTTNGDLYLRHVFNWDTLAIDGKNTWYLQILGPQKIRRFGVTAAYPYDSDLSKVSDDSWGLYHDDYWSDWVPRLTDDAGYLNSIFGSPFDTNTDRQDQLMLGGDLGFTMIFFVDFLYPGGLLYRGRIETSTVCYMLEVTEAGMTLHYTDRKILFPYSKSNRIPMSKSLTYRVITLTTQGNNVKIFLDHDLFGEANLTKSWSELQCVGPQYADYVTIVGAARPSTDLTIVRNTRGLMGGSIGRIVMLNYMVPNPKLWDLAHEFREFDAYYPVVTQTCNAFAPEFDDAWTNAAGQGCDWYRAQVDRGIYEICDTDARFYCPIACGRAEPCLAPTTVSGESTTLFDRIRKFDTASVICPSESFYAQRKQLQEKCNALYPMMTTKKVGIDRLEFYEDLQSKDPEVVEDYPPFVSPESVRSCDFLADHGFLSKSCSYKDEALSMPNGEGTMYFWTYGVRHVEVLTEKEPGSGWENHQPLLRLMSTKGSQGGYFSGVNGSCDLLDHVSLSGVGQAHNDNEWLFWAITKTDHRFEALINYVYSEPIKASGCLDHKWGALAFSGVPGMMVSEIKVRQKPMGRNEIQAEYYSTRTQFQRFQGPRQSDLSIASGSTLDTRPYVHQIHSVAPPLVTATVAGSKPCTGLEASSIKIQNQQYEHVCQYPSECPADSGLRCIDHDTAATTHLARNSQMFLGKPTFGEFLYTLDNAILVRDGQQFTQTDFFGPATQSMDIYVVLYTQVVDLLSVVKINFKRTQFNGPIVKGSFQVLNYPAITDARFTVDFLPFAVGGLVLAFILMIGVFLRMFDAMRYGWKFVSLYDKTKVVVFFWLYDLALLTMVIVFLIQRALYWKGSYATLSGMLDRLSAIEWSNGDLSFQDKIKDYYLAVDGITEEAVLTISNDRFVMALLIMMIIKMMKQLSAHAKVSLLPSTLVRAADDLLHFIISSSIIYCGIGCLAWKLFGRSYPIFGTFLRTMGTQFQFLNGEFPEGWMDDISLAVYTVLFASIVYYMLLSFLLAIIVEAYMELRQEIIASSVEDNFLSDVVTIFVYLGFKTAIGWPKHSRIIREFERYPNRNLIHFAELEQSGLFRDSKSAARYMLFYRYMHGFVIGDSAANIEATAEAFKGPEANQFTELVNEVKRRQLLKSNIRTASGQELPLHEQVDECAESALDKIQGLIKELAKMQSICEKAPLQNYPTADIHAKEVQGIQSLISLAQSQIVFLQGHMSNPGYQKLGVPPRKRVLGDQREHSVKVDDYSQDTTQSEK